VKYVLMLASDFEYKQDIDEAVQAGCAGWSEEMQRRGILLTATGLAPSSDATTVRVRDDQVLLTDGPFAETKDQVGGLSIIECADLDEALELAAKHPWAKVGQVEVRPVWEP
jgi:hypothetical protein